MSNSRLVYSTAVGRTCPNCGWPIDNCQCSKTLSSGKSAIFVVFKTPEEGIGIPVSLKGFADGFAQLP